MKAEVILCCWQCGTQARDVLTLKQEEKARRQIDDKLYRCATCSSTSIFIFKGRTVFDNQKLFQCTQGHITSVSILNTETLHVRSDNENFVNVVGTIDSLPVMIDAHDITCQHDCGLPLEAIDDVMLSYPESPAFKTKTRVGDLWDKQGVEPVRSGSYDANGDYKRTKSEEANKARLEHMNRTRNINPDKAPKTVSTNRPTERIYKRKK